MTIRTLGSRYLLDEQIGQGGMGVVWRGRDKVTGTPFAIKLLRSEYAADPDAVTRFVRERTVLMKFRHPAVVTLHDMIVEGDQLALVMDLVQGGDLSSYRQRRGGTLTNADAARLSAQICDGLAAAHGAGIVHRDLKPANVLLDDGQVKLADFGVARIVGDPSATTTGTVLGTAAYLAPELLTGSEPSPASDVYAFGITMYELLAGRPPFSGHVGAIMHDHLETAPPRLPEVPDQLWDLLSSCLAKDPEARPAAAAMANALREPGLLAMLDPPAPQPLPGDNGRALAAAPNRQVPPQSFARGPVMPSPSADPQATPPPVSLPVIAPQAITSALDQPSAPVRMRPPAPGPERQSALQSAPTQAQVIPLRAAAAPAPAQTLAMPMPAPEQNPAAPPADPITPTPSTQTPPTPTTTPSGLSPASPSRARPRPARAPRKPASRKPARRKPARRKPALRKPGSKTKGKGLIKASPAAMGVAAVVVLALVATGVMALGHVGPFASAPHKTAAGTGPAAGSGIVADPGRNVSPGTSGGRHTQKGSASSHDKKKPAAKKSRSLPSVSTSPSGSARTGGGGSGTLVPYGPNLVTDGTFSDPSLGAWDFAIEKAVMSPGIGVDGQNAVVLTATPQAGIAESINGLRSGGRYVVTGWVHAVTTPVYIGARDEESGAEVDVSSLSSSWKKLSVDFTVPRGQSSAVIFCVQQRGGTGYCSDFAVYALHRS